MFIGSHHEWLPEGVSMSGALRMGCACRHEVRCHVPLLLNCYVILQSSTKFLGAENLLYCTEYSVVISVLTVVNSFSVRSTVPA